MLCLYSFVSNYPLNFHRSHDVHLHHLFYMHFPTNHHLFAINLPTKSHIFKFIRADFDVYINEYLCNSHWHNDFLIISCCFLFSFNDEIEKNKLMKMFEEKCGDSFFFYFFVRKQCCKTLDANKTLICHLSKEMRTRDEVE